MFSKISNFLSTEKPTTGEALEAFGLFTVKEVQNATTLDSPKTNVARITAIWNKWLNSHASSSSSLYVEPAVHRFDVEHREMSDLVVCTYDGSYEATWKVIFAGYPGTNNPRPNEPAASQWIVIRDHMQHVCARHKSKQSPTHVITTLGRWVRFWTVQSDGTLNPVVFEDSGVRYSLDMGHAGEAAKIDSKLKEIVAA